MADTLRDVPLEFLALIDQIGKEIQRGVRDAWSGAIDALRAAFREALAAGADQPHTLGEVWSAFRDSIEPLYGPDGPIFRGLIRRGDELSDLVGARWAITNSGYQQRAAVWVLDHGGQRITRETAATRTAINRLVAEGFTAPRNVSQTARLLYELPSIGLDWPRQRALNREMRELLDGEGARWSAARVQREMERRYLRKKRSRTRTIAFTESQTAGNAAVDLMTLEARSSGELDERFVLEWVARLINVCPICQALDGVRREIEEGAVFVSRPIAEGTYAGQQLQFARPTAHPYCYCGIRAVDRSEAVEIPEPVAA